MLIFKETPLHRATRCYSPGVATAHSRRGNPGSQLKRARLLKFDRIRLPIFPRDLYLSLMKPLYCFSTGLPLKVSDSSRTGRSCAKFARFIGEEGQMQRTLELQTDENQRHMPERRRDEADVRREQRAALDRDSSRFQRGRSGSSARHTDGCPNATTESSTQSADKCAPATPSSHGPYSPWRLTLEAENDPHSTGVYPATSSAYHYRASTTLPGSVLNPPMIPRGTPPTPSAPNPWGEGWFGCLPPGSNSTSSYAPWAAPYGQAQGIHDSLNRYSAQIHSQSCPPRSPRELIYERPTDPVVSTRKPSSRR